MINFAKRSAAVGAVGMTMLTGIVLAPSASAWEMRHPQHHSCTIGAENAEGWDNPAGGYGKAYCDLAAYWEEAKSYRVRVTCTPWHGNSTAHDLHGPWKSNSVAFPTNETVSKGYSISIASCAWYEQPTAVDIEFR